MISPVRWVVKLNARYLCYVEADSLVRWCAERCPYEIRFFRSLAVARRVCRRVRRLEKRAGRDPSAVRVVALWPKSMPVEHRRIVRGVLRLLTDGSRRLVASLQFHVRELGGGK